MLRVIALWNSPAAGDCSTIVGHTDGNAFDADEIDTDGAEPDASRPGAGYYTGPYDAGLYAPYVIPLGGGGYYYGGNGYYGGGYQPFVLPTKASPQPDGSKSFENN